MSASNLRHDWTAKQVNALFTVPFNDLLFEAQRIHRQHFDANAVQISSLLSIKTGGCEEDCAYCPQSAFHDTDVEPEPVMSLDAVKQSAQAAKENGASRFCMGAAWRSPSDTDMQQCVDMVKTVKDMGMETCMTLGMLTAAQAQQLKQAGLDYYNHNLDTSPEFYNDIITTRTYQERLDTLQHVRDAGMNVCCGGILGMGESRDDRNSLLRQLANLPHHPESVPINLLVSVEGTPMEETAALDPLEFVRTIAVARIMMPASFLRLSAGREDMSDELQALCFFAGANSIFYGETLLTTPNATQSHDAQLFERLGLSSLVPESSADSLTG